MAVSLSPAPELLQIATQIKILIVDDHPVVRQGLAAMITGQPDMVVVGEARNGREAVDQFRALLPDVTLMDLRMPDLDGVQAIAVIREEFRNARVIILTTFDHDEDIYRGLRVGAMAFLLKDAEPDVLYNTIRAAHGGQKRIPEEMAVKLVERMTTPELTARELEVLGLLAAGRSNREIADALFISSGTVRAHVGNLFSKLQVNDRTQAATLAIRRGLVPLP